MRYSNETKEKENGVVYTPADMAKYLSEQMIKYSSLNFQATKEISILDPAVGSGELLIALIKEIKKKNPKTKLIVVGYETDNSVAKKTETELSFAFPQATITIINSDFLAEADCSVGKFDFVIANPPYIRTQILGAEKAQAIAQKTGLTGKIDIYYAFLISIKKMLKPTGISGYITSNKFFTIKSGSSVRDFMVENYQLHEIIDFGDTKLFSASVLPCIVIFSLGKTRDSNKVHFISIYETNSNSENSVYNASIFDSINENCFCTLQDGRKFEIKHGNLESSKRGSLWVIASDEKRKWLDTVDSNTWMRFSDIGKVRVGIKTTADNVFIGNDWSGDKEGIELLKPLITHRDAGQIISKKNAGWKVLYTHTINNGKKEAVNINDYPKSKEYLERHYEQLSGRKYIQKANRNWYEIWVPQNPAAWSNRKIVFRDISEHPEFWLDESGSVVNGDCYWIDIYNTVFEDTIFLALAIANSSFIEKYYDAKFNTKLYSGKRRFMSQYVEQFPIPFMNSHNASIAVEIVKKIIAEGIDNNTSRYMDELDAIVESLFIS